MEIVEKKILKMLKPISKMLHITRICMYNRKPMKSIQNYIKNVIKRPFMNYQDHDENILLLYFTKLKFCF